MRPEIKNELLLQVIQAWDPAEADKWSFDVECLVWAGWGIRHSDKDLFPYHNASGWKEASELAAFLLKDRPALRLYVGYSFKPGVPVSECNDATGGCWDTDPWGTTTRAKNLVTRLKAYEYLREWKESQQSVIDPSDVTLSICGQAIEGMTIHDDALGSNQFLTGYKGPKLGKFVSPSEVPATYDQICPHCNWSKEVNGWQGKESCQACS